MSVANVEQWTIEEICLLPTDTSLLMDIDSKYCLLKIVPILFLKKNLETDWLTCMMIIRVLTGKICIQGGKSYQ